MNNIKIIPTFLRIQISEKSHRLAETGLEKDNLKLKLKSYFNFDSVAKETRAGIYKDILSDLQSGNMILPYLEERPAGEWHYGRTVCDLGSMQTTDRILICEKAREVSEAEAAEEDIFAETDAEKELLTIYRNQEEYDKLAPGCTGLKLLIRNFYDNKNVLFECHIDKIPVPGIDVGNYVFSDGSRTATNVTKGEKAVYNWGNLCVNGTMVKAAIGNGKSNEWNAAAEKDGCLIALSDNICGWTKEDDITVFFDCVNNAYPLLGWYARTKYTEEIETLAGNFKSLTFYHIDAHTGAVGNELADSLANETLRKRYHMLGEADGLTLDSHHVQKLYMEIIMKKIVKKGYLLPVAVMYAFFIVITIVFIFIYRHEHNVKTQGIPIQCKILSVTQEWESDNDLLEGGIYQDITCVKYIIDGVEYTDTIRADLGETGDEIELIYLPSNPEKVYSLIVMESGSEIMKYIAIGWFVYWLFMTVLLIFIMIRNKRKKDLRNENHIYLT